MGTTAFSGNRRFVWFEPAKKRPTEYESYTVGQQSSPEQWLDVDWPLRFDDGRAPFIAESTALRCEHWGDYRDPSQTWQRPYVARHNHEEQAIAMLIPEAMRDGLAATIAPAWRNQILGKYYAAWPFVEYGRFLCMCYVVREALADTLTFAFAFQAADHLRHNQDIVHLLLELKEAVPGFTDEDARPAWMKDPILVPLRETIERIYSLTDWAEIVVALNLALEPLAGTLVKSELLARHAPHHGDAVTPMILAGVHHDTQRQLDATKAFVRMVCGDRTHGEANRRLLRHWLETWTPRCETAGQALGGLFSLPGLSTAPFPPCWERVAAGQRAAVAELGLSGGRS